MGHLPSIDLVRIQDGEVSAVPIKKRTLTQSAASDPLGFVVYLKNFRDKVYHADFGCPGSDIDPVCSCPTWTLRSTRKQKSGAYPLGASAIFQPSRYKTLLVRTRHVACLSAHNLTHCAGGVTTMLDDFTPDWQGQGNV